MTDNISIIGGGIGGLVTALSFEKLDIPYKLYERAGSIREIGAGIWLSPNALQVLEWIDPNLLKEIQKAGNALNRITVANHKLSPISDSEQGFVKKEFGYTTVAIHRGKLQRILYKNVQQKNIQLNKTFKSYQKDTHGSLKVNFTDHSSILSKSIIGADGIHSNVRKQLFPDSLIRYSGQTCWRGIASYDMDSKLGSTGFTLWGEKLQFGISKISDGQVYWFAVKLSKPNLQDDKEKLKSILIDMFSNYHPIVEKLIRNTPLDKIIRNDLSDLKPLSNWSKENICLIGDAAHSMTPDLGQGGAQAIEDAYYLSNFIKNSIDIKIAYYDFYIYRKSKVEKLVKQSRLTSKIAITNRIGEICRNFILKNTPKKLIEKQMIETYCLDKTIINSTNT